MKMQIVGYDHIMNIKVEQTQESRAQIEEALGKIMGPNWPYIALSTDRVLEIADNAEARLDELGIHSRLRKGAVYASTINQNPDVPLAKNKVVSVIAVRLSRGARDWFWTKARLDFEDSRDFGKSYLMLTKAQDEEAVLRLREKYIIAGAPISYESQS
jgi:hypothetical protein